MQINAPCVNHRDREADALAEVTAKYKDEIDMYIALQFLFDKQWKALKAYANLKGIKLLGDMPIYVSGHSADVWSNAHLFVLDKDKKPDLVPTFALTNNMPITHGVFMFNASYD